MDQSLKFTPGPWKARGTLGPLRAEHLKGPFVIEVAATGQYLTTMNGWRSDQQEVDARLMAAAPELLDALTNLLDWAENQCGLSGNDECYGAFDSEEIVTASRLLERLKGEAHGC